MTKLYFAPGACSLGIHLLLEEIGTPYEMARVNLQAGEQYKPPYTDLNPKSKVPALERNDGQVLTEFPAIATWLAMTNPGAKLLPSDPDAMATVLEATDYAVATIHMQGFARLFRSSNFAPSEADHDAVKARGHEIIAKGFGLLDEKLAGKDYIAGDFSIADAALFYVERWATTQNVPMPDNVAAHFARMKARPSVAAAMQQEGLS